MDENGALSRLHILLVEDDAAHAAEMRQALVRMEAGVRVTTAGRLRSALEALHDPAIRCVVTDVRLPDAEGLGVVLALRTARREVPVIVVTAAGSEELAVGAMKMGAADYVSRHERYIDELPTLVREALGRSVLADVEESRIDGALQRPAAPTEQAFIATTASMREVMALVERAARSAVPVLLDGETGTGKEFLAWAIHQRGPRCEAPFLAQNCAAISESLLESELFGHCRGAFTGAERDRHGLFEEAGDGTVFLDEIGEAPPAVQAKLLRVLQHEEVKAVGADRVRRVRARIVAASNRSLEAEVRAGRFRLDLYYRLAVFPIRVPPLRHRMADLPALVSHFLGRFELRESRETGGFDADALRALQSYPWPGNVRELESEVHRLVLSVGQGRRICHHHLARRIRDADPMPLDEPLQRILQRVEIALIRQRLQQKPTKSATARSLGITREALYAKMRRLGMGTGTG
ncbi:MAG TPA: sigma-54 dependent transcriptional regulator [Candidatus Binatus sp.]|nr:sigma-54 dependent transcriptional regulator [Candidatus Binatus sp.]